MPSPSIRWERNAMTKEQKQFSGGWKWVALDILQDYLKTYCEALEDRRFTRHYAEPFAGMGRYELSRDKSQPKLLPDDGFTDTAIIALETDPGFHVHHFNAVKDDYVAGIRRMAADFSGTKVKISCRGADKFTKNLCSSLGALDRAVLFVDPHGAKIGWKTIVEAASTRKVDLWLMFPRLTVLQMMKVSKNEIKQSSRKILNRMLGTNAWEEDLYPEGHRQSQSIFDVAAAAAPKRAGFSEVESWITQRIRSVFAHVSAPAPLVNSKNNAMYLLYFASPKAANARVAVDTIQRVLQKRGRSYIAG